jgi:hypothetical protein
VGDKTCNVTPTVGSVRRDKSRNEVLEAELEVALAEPISELSLSWNGSEENVLTKRTRGFLRRTAYRCWWCDHVFVEGDILYRQFRRPALCETCAEKQGKWSTYYWESRRKPIPCEGACGALVSTWGYWPPSSPYLTCSTRCGGLARNTRRRRARPVECAGCGETFEQTRSDTRYCSNACRQKAYRRRKLDRELDHTVP